MPLLDHFHPPLHPTRHWESFHAVWASEIMGYLNQQVLPEKYYAETQVHIGSRVEVDVATLERMSPASSPHNGPGGVAVIEEVWAPPVPPMVIPTQFPDEIEVQIFSSHSGGLYLVAAIELVSSGNKDRIETRQAFAAKCASYLQLGIGLVIVDVVTDRRGSLHDELMRLMNRPDEFLFKEGTELYAVSYRPARRAAGDQIDCWPMTLQVGDALPAVPLPLRDGPTLRLDLECSYAEARKRSRL